MAYSKLSSFPDQFEDANGDPLDGGLIEFYLNGTSTPAAVYADSSGTALGVTVGLNSRGVPKTSGGTPTEIYGDTSVVYKAILKDSAGGVIDTYEDIYPRFNDGAISVSSISSLKALSKVIYDTVHVTGYYEAGDGGGGHYWLDTSDTTSADNGGTIIVATDGGRWKLISAHGVSIAQFGAVGDDSDETAELDAALTWASVSKKTVWFEENKTYRSTQSLVLESPLDLGGSVLKFVVTGTEKCLDVRTNGSVFNGEIELAGSAYSGSGDSGCPIIIGDYGVGTGYENIKISNLTIASNKPSGSNGIMVTGDSNNIEIENITFSDSSTLDRGILIHWGGATTPSSGTYHPYNIKINNIVAKNQTGMSTTSDGIVFVSGAYNVSINGVSGDNVGCGILFYAGDYGTQYAGEAAAFLGKGLSVNNVQLDDVTAYAIYTNGNGSVAGTSYTVPLSINAKNIKATGNGAADGIFLTYCDGSIWENCEMSGFADNGFRVGRRAINGVIKGGKYSGNGNNGVYFYDDTTTPKYWNVEGVEATLNNTGANANPYERAGIAIRSASHIRVSGCKFGDTSETQVYSIRVESAADTVWIERNHTVELAATGVAYSIGASTDYTINPMGSNNTAASGLTVYGGCPLFYIDSAGKKTLSASAAPASGTWAVGDKVWFTAPAAGGAPGAICTTAGTPGTWKNMANLAA